MKALAEVIAVVAFLSATLIGWITNVIHVGGSSGFEFAIRLLGVFFAPLGVLLGWFA